MLAERFNLTERQELPFEENKNKKEAVRIEELLKTHICKHGVILYVRVLVRSRVLYGVCRFVVSRVRKVLSSDVCLVMMHTACSMNLDHFVDPRSIRSRLLLIAYSSLQAWRGLSIARSTGCVPSRFL